MGHGRLVKFGKWFGKWLRLWYEKLRLSRGMGHGRLVKFGKWFGNCFGKQWWW